MTAVCWSFLIASNMLIEITIFVFLDMINHFYTTFLPLFLCRFETHIAGSATHLVYYSPITVYCTTQNYAADRITTYLLAVDDK